MGSDDMATRLTLSYCKKEFLVTTVYLATAFITMVCFLSSNLFYKFNENRLPLRMEFELLPFAGSFVNWLLNYLYQIYVSVFPSSFFYLYFSMTLIIMHHSCWGAEITLLLVQQLGKVLEDEDDREAAKILRQVLVAKKLKKIIVMTYRMIDYRDRVQSLMQLSFITDFTMSSFLICMCLFTIKTGIFTAVLFPTVLTQLFIYCWIGDRVIGQYEILAESLYGLRWYLMDTKQQKDLQLILLRVQAMKGFHGIFKTVSLETFQKVCCILNVITRAK